MRRIDAWRIASPFSEVALKVRRGRSVQQAEQPAAGAQLAAQRVRSARIRAVDVVRQGVQGRERLGRVEIVAEGIEDRGGIRAWLGGAVGRVLAAVVAQRPIQRVEAGLGLGEQGVAPRQTLPVVAGEQGVAERLAVVGVEQFADGDDVADALGHLRRAEGQHAVVHPVAHARLAAVDAAALRAFVLVVREGQVAAAAVNVDHRAQVLADHRRALDVPAGASAPPGAVPSGERGARRLPQHEVLGILLVGSDFHPRAVAHFVEAALGKRTIGRVRRNMEQHMGAVPGVFARLGPDGALGRIGVSAGDERFDHADDLGDVFRCPGLDVGIGDAERFDVAPVFGGVGVGQFGDGAAGLPGGGVDLVVHVGDVADVFDVAVRDPQQPHQHVEDDRRQRIADVDEAVDRRPADVDAHRVRLQRLETLLGARLRVVKADFHVRGGSVVWQLRWPSFEPARCWRSGLGTPARLNSAWRRASDVRR